MEVKQHVVLLVALILIGGAILFILSMKTEAKQSFSGNNSSQNLAQKDALFPKAPDLAGISGYINAPQGLKLSDLKGKVVLIDFWTYTCINCIRTLPYLTAWDEKYRDKGLVVIGVHTPEFEFEKDYANVQKAVEKFGIKYPVVQDNDYATWNAYQNRFWPHEFLIDADGYIRYDDIGEGGYAETESEIQKLLSERDAKIQMGALVVGNVPAPKVNFTQIGTPEIYVGSSLARSPLGNPEGFQEGAVVNYSIPKQIDPNLVYFGGSWKNNPDNMELASDSGKIVLRFQAKNVNIVSYDNSTLSVYLDDKNLTSDQLGSDAKLLNGTATVLVNDQRLYSLVDKQDYNPQTIEIDVNGKGFKLYTFTFG